MADLPPGRQPEHWYPILPEEGSKSQTTGEDVDRALKVAEFLMSEGHHESRHLQNLRFGAVSFLIITLLSIGGLAVGFIRYEAAALLVVAFLVGGPALVALLRLAVRPTRATSTIIAAEIAAMIGELLTEVAGREQWSHLRLESTRLRLSRFPLVDRHTFEAGDLADVEHLFGPEEPG
jgi:hypothetical protein